MSTAAQSRPAQQAAPAKALDAAKLLDQVLDNTSFNERFKITAEGIDRRIERIEEALPPQMKGQAARLAKRAQMTLARVPDLADCPPQEFIRCVLEAAEMGLAIDGRLAYVVRFKSAWQLIISYQGLIAVARRSGVLKDVFGDVVCENDLFEAWRDGARSHLKHRYDLTKKHRGEVVAAYMVFVLPDGSWRYELMERSELDRIKARAPSKKGPWATDEREMQKKSVVRRGMKYYSDDPGIAQALAAEDRVDELERLESAERQPAEPPSERVSLRNGNGAPAAAPGLPPPSRAPEAAETPEPPAQPAPPETTPEQAQEQMAVEDRMADWGQRCAAADGEQALTDIGMEADEHKDWIGKGNYQKVQAMLKARRKELAQPAEMPRADF